MGLVTNRGSEINVTPLIDVLLVLLVIFLIVMPSLTTFEEVHTPAPPGEASDVPPHLIVRVRADLSVELVDDDQHIVLEGSQMSAGLRAHLRETTHIVFVELDNDLPWEHVVSTIDEIHGIAPTTQVALVTSGR